MKFGLLVLLFLSQLSIAQKNMDAYLFAYFEGTGKGELRESFTKDFYPRHGSVIGITKEGVKQLNDKRRGAPKNE